MANKPNAINKRGSKVHLDGYVFDSKKEAEFYKKFVKNCKLPFDVHPSFELEGKANIVGPVNVSSIKYTPDFIIKDWDGEWLHVYDVKNDLSEYSIDASAKLRFRLFAMKYKHPVEAVKVNANNFKTMAVGVTKPLNKKTALTCTSVHYPWIKATNY